MPYSGGPSKGCKTCRTRKVKCDEGRPTCRNCERGNRACGGYREEYDLMHRDETVKTMLRVQRIKSGKARSRPPPPQAGHGQYQLVHLGMPPPLAASLSEPYELQAEHYFAANFILEPCGSGGGVAGGGGGIMDGHLAFLMPMLRSQPEGSPLREAFQACALGAFGNRRTAQHVRLWELAQQRYISALSSVSVAIGRDAGHLDATLATVLLLSQYESLMAAQTREAIFDGWGAHVRGAINLVKKRGTEQLKSRTGLLLFTAVRSQLIRLLLSSDLSEVVGMDRWICNHNSGSLIEWAQQFAFKVAELRLEVARACAGGHHKTPEGIEYLEQLSRQVQEVEWELANWMRNVPEPLRFRALAWLGEDEVEEQRARCRAAAKSHGRADHPDPTGWHGVDAFSGRVDMYPGHTVAYAWNVMRSTRLVLCSLRLQCIARMCWPLDYRERGEFATVRGISQAIVAGIVSSIPYQLGWRGRRRSPRTAPAATATTTRTSTADPKSPGQRQGDELERARWDLQLAEGSKGNNNNNNKYYHPTASFACGRSEDELEEEGIVQLKVAPAQFAMWSLAAVQNFDETTENQREWCRGRLLYIADQLGIKAARGLAKVRSLT